jgi:protein SCO1/2/putative membrane protein
LSVPSAPSLRLAMAAGLALSLAGCVPSSLPPVLGEPVPEFRLTTHTGRPLTRTDLLGRPWLADFIFTSCGDTCPAMTAHMARLRGKLPADVRLVSFTVDPGHDTPEVLAAYARPFDPGERWLFVTGTQADLFRLSVDGFKLVAAEVPPDQQVPGGDGPFLHSTRFVLVDASAQVVGYYDSADPQALEQLERDAQRLDRRARRWPKVNAGLNALAALLLLGGYALVRAGRRDAHRACMLAALTASAGFLISYLAYHARVGSMPFLGQGPLRTAYLAILLSHTVLAAVIVPLAGVTVWRAGRGDFARHRRIARLTLPLWLYVSVTGVVVYWMVYQL